MNGSNFALCVLITQKYFKISYFFCLFLPYVWSLITVFRVNIHMYKTSRVQVNMMHFIHIMIYICKIVSNQSKNKYRKYLKWKMQLWSTNFSLCVFVCVSCMHKQQYFAYSEVFSCNFIRCNFKVCQGKKLVVISKHTKCSTTHLPRFFI